MIYPYGNCSAVPAPQSLILYYSNLLNYSTSLGGFTIGGSAPISLLDPLSVDDPAVLNLITLNQEASHFHHCLQYYCDQTPDVHILQESHGVCTESESITAIATFVAEDPTVMTLVSHKVQDRVYVYSSIPVPEEVCDTAQDCLTHEYIVLHGKTRKTTVPAIAITVPATSKCTNISITPVVDTLIYRAHYRDKFVDSILANTTTTVSCLQQFEVMWIEPRADHCNRAGPNLQGTIIRSTIELAIYVAEAECNVTRGNRGFGYVGNLIHALPPVRRWGATFIVDLHHLQNQSSHEQLEASLHIVAAEETDIVTSAYAPGEKEPIDNGKYKLESNEPLTIKVDHFHTQTLVLQSSAPVLVMYEVYSRVSGEPYFSTLLQPMEWFTQQQSLLLAHSLVSQVESYHITLMMESDSESYDITKLQVQVGSYQQTISLLDYLPFHVADIDSHSIGNSSVVIIHVVVDLEALGSGDTHVVVKSVDDCTKLKLGASVIYHGEQSGYAHTNLYILGEFCCTVMLDYYMHIGIHR